MSEMMGGIKGTARARFFANHGIETCRVLVETDGTVRVWDTVGGLYTICHSLSPRAQRRIARQVRARAEARDALHRAEMS